MSVCRCIIAAWSDSPLPLAVVQLLTTLLIAGLDKSLHIMSKEFQSSKRHPLLDLDLKSIDVGPVVKRKGEAFEWCSNWAQGHTLSPSPRHISWKMAIARENNRKIRELGCELLPCVLFSFSKSSIWSDLFVWVSLTLVSAVAQRGPLLMCCIPEKIKKKN